MVAFYSGDTTFCFISFDSLVLGVSFADQALETSEIILKYCLSRIHNTKSHAFFSKVGILFLMLVVLFRFLVIISIKKCHFLVA